MTVHHVPKTISDYFALAVVKVMRVPADLAASDANGTSG
jgi:hypothetical protein